MPHPRSDRPPSTVHRRQSFRAYELWTVDCGLWTKERVISTRFSGLTLVELMVATSILAIGIVLVARALLTASTALDSMDNRIKAVGFLEAKMAELQQQANEEGGVLPGNTTGTTTLNFRPATWTVEIVPVELQGAAPQGGKGSAEKGTAPEQQATQPTAPKDQGTEEPKTEQKDAPKNRLAEVRLTLSWQEAHRKQDTALMTYLGQRSAPEPEPKS